LTETDERTQGDKLKEESCLWCPGVFGPRPSIFQAN